MRILIGTPTGDGMVNMQYMRAIRELETAFKTQEPPIASDVVFVTSSFLPFSRNGLASVVLEQRAYTHLLFVDSDMGFQPEAVLKLLKADKDVIGCLYPKRTIDYARFHRVAQEVENVDQARSIALDYAASEQLQKRAIDTLAGKRLVHVMEHGLIRTLRLGMGLTLIKREVFERMAEKLPDIVVDTKKAVHYAAMGLRGRVIQCFASVSVNNISMSEDLSFCRRWTEDCGGEIWACVDQRISHFGGAEFTGTMSDRIGYVDNHILADTPQAP